MEESDKKDQRIIAAESTKHRPTGGHVFVRTWMPKDEEVNLNINYFTFLNVQ